jgi:anti-sigma factor RsiW
MKIPHRDELLLQRHLDGELDAAASAAFTARLASEPELARALADAKALQSGFRAARADTMRPPASFAASVLAAVRQLPSRLELERADVAAAGVTLCRRLLLVAALLVGAGMAWHFGLLHDDAPATVEAAPGDVQRELERLDALLQSGAVPPPKQGGAPSPK